MSGVVPYSARGCLGLFLIAPCDTDRNHMLTGGIDIEMGCTLLQGGGMGYASYNNTIRGCLPAGNGKSCHKQTPGTISNRQCLSRRPSGIIA